MAISKDDSRFFIHTINGHEVSPLPRPVGRDCPDHPTYPLVWKERQPYCRRGQHHVIEEEDKAEWERGRPERERLAAERVTEDERLPSPCPDCGGPRYIVAGVERCQRCIAERVRLAH